jgi:transcriptional regulator with XRE-family HTH domain
MNDLNIEIGLRLKQIRKDHHMSQGTFSNKLNISPSHYSRIERGILPLNPLEMDTIVKQFLISINWLITGQGEKSAPKWLKDKIINNVISNDEEVQELVNFLKTFPMYKNQLITFMEKFLAENKESLNKESKAFLKRFTRQKKMKRSHKS